MNRLLLLGGGHSHLAALAPLRRLLPDRPIALLAPSAQLLYSGMMPGWLAGQYRFEACTIPLREHCRRLGIEWIEARALDIRFGDRCVIDEGGRAHPFQRLSINVGADVATPDAAQHEEEALVIGAKPFERFVGAWTNWLDAARRTPRARTLAVVGAGPAGVELALALAARVRREAALAGSQVTLYSADAGLLPGQSRLAARLALRALRRHGIAFLGGHRFLGCDGPGALRFGGAAGRQVRRADLAILATGARPPDWLTRAARREGIDVGEDGGIAVDACLRSPSDAQVWAAGDCASFVGMRVPRSGVHALRQGPALAASLAAESGACAQPYRPSRHALALLNCCDGSAIAVRGPFAAAGQWAWRWKDRIDRGFIARFGAGASARGGL